MPTPNVLADASIASFREGLNRHAPLAAAAIGGGMPFLCAVSGGADSMALLLLADAAFPTQCHAATVDHGLRAAAAKEAAFVSRFCRDREIVHVTLKAPMPKRAQGGANVSARARALRYTLLEAQRVAIGGAAILTAHHADDQLETLIMRLNRGAGLAGLAGIRGETRTIARPMLDWTHDEAVALLKGEGVEWIEDPSNADDRYDRARLRKTLAESDLFDVKAVARSVALLGEADALMDALAGRAMRGIARANNAIALAIADHPPEIRRRLTLRCLRLIAPGIEPRHEQIERLWQALSRGRAATLGGVMVRPLRDGAWQFSPAPPRAVPETK